MLESVLQKKKTSEQSKCIRCKEREATDEDQMCDSCRFTVALENIIKSRK